VLVSQVGLPCIRVLVVKRGSVVVKVDHGFGPMASIEMVSPGIVEIDLDNTQHMCMRHYIDNTRNMCIRQYIYGEKRHSVHVFVYSHVNINTRFGASACKITHVIFSIRH
jgi:hypothetical protein